MKSVAIHITLPEALLREVDALAQREHRNRSEITREALRRYLEERRRRALEEEQRRRLLRALEETAGSWADEAHPELMKREDARRLRERLWKLDQERLPKP